MNHLFRSIGFRSLQMPGGLLMFGGTGLLVLSLRFGWYVSHAFGFQYSHLWALRGLCLLAALLGYSLIALSEKIEPKPAVTTSLLHLDDANEFSAAHSAEPSGE